MSKLFVVEGVVIGKGKVVESVEARNLKEAIIKLKLMYEQIEKQTLIVIYAKSI